MIKILQIRLLTVMMAPGLFFVFNNAGTIFVAKAHNTVSGSDIPTGKVIDIGSRLELFVDDYLTEYLRGGAHLRLHHPEPKEIAIVHDEPWEGSGSGYYSVFRDGDIFRMYYKAWHRFVTEKGMRTDTIPYRCCYSESRDGIHWTKPELGIYEFQGSKANNIILMTGPEVQYMNAAHPAVFKDEKPGVSRDEQYKAFFPRFQLHYPDNPERTTGLLAFKSADGIHWSLMSTSPVITGGGFDSQNTAFWDAVKGEYRAYWRTFTEEKKTDRPADLYVGMRAIRTGTSKDFMHWENIEDLKYVDSPLEQLYTNQIKPYYRAPHIYIGFPTRYVDRGWTGSTQALPDLQQREWRAGPSRSNRHGTAVTESLFMTSHDGVTFKRWNEAFLRPGIERSGTWNYGQQYVGWSVIETKSALEGAPNELSMYAVEKAWIEPGCAARRFTLRIDGFVSVNAPVSGGEIVTKPLTFSGKNLILNFSSSAAGGIQVEIQDETGRPLPGFTLNDCPPIFGDTIERMVTWKNGSDLSSLQGKPVKLRFVLKDTDLFSLRFR